MKKILTAISSLLLLTSLSANNVQITNVSMGVFTVSFDISWDNSWCLGDGSIASDGIWIVIKDAPNGGPSWQHSNITSATAGSGFETIISSDNVGFILKRTGSFNGTSSTSLTVGYSPNGGTYRDLKVMATEMVRVVNGAFYVGDGWSDRTLHKGDDATASYYVNHEGAIPVGTGSNDIYGGNLNAGNTEIPAEFPKGFNLFYCMKYQITMKQYVDFLNCQPRIWQDILTNSSLAGTTVANYYVMTNINVVSADNVIRCDEQIGTGNINFYCDRDNDGIPNEADDGMHRGINNLTVAQLLAYLDWIGLAPMTALEYEKACRGPLAAVPGEFAWGSTLYNAAGNIVNAGQDNEKYSNSGVEGGICLVTSSSNNKSIRVGCNAPSTAGTRELSNGSYYGVIGLSFFNNDVVSVRTDYDGSHGNGSLSNGAQDSFGNITSLQSKFGAISIMSNTDTKRRVSSYNGTTLPTNQTASGRGVRRF